ncbi:hypothetical protein QFZ94_007441 [Paraburkholderia sp. JPY465]
MRPASARQSAARLHCCLSPDKPLYPVNEGENDTMRSVYKVKWRMVRSGSVPVRFVCVTDLNLGRSVTNNIEGVIDDLIRAGWLDYGDRMIYSDAHGIWDEVVLGEDCRFLGFRSLNMRTCDEAITLGLLSSRYPEGI